MTNEPTNSTLQISTASMNEQAVRDPLFILGMHRSGTTLLYEMLSVMGHWNTLSAWHVASYDEIREGRIGHEVLQANITKRLADAGMETRGVDAVVAGPGAREEYCFIMDNKGFGNELTPRAFPMFQEICATVQGTHSCQRPLLLKNPWDFANGHVIQELIPSARFVYIHRHPMETVSSMWHFLHAALQEPNPYMEMLSRRYRDITHSRWKMGLLGNVVRRCPGSFIDALIWWFGSKCDGYLKSNSRIPEHKRIDITYDELCGHPNETMARIRQHFNVADNGTDYSSMISRRKAVCDRLVTAKSRKIERRMREYVRHMQQFPTH